MGNAYWFAPRPPDVSHRHPFLVFDCQDQLHFELTVLEKRRQHVLKRKPLRGIFVRCCPFLLTWRQTNGKGVLAVIGGASRILSEAQLKTI